MVGYLFEGILRRVVVGIDALLSSSPEMVNPDVAV